MEIQIWNLKKTRKVSLQRLRQTALRVLEKFSDLNTSGQYHPSCELSITLVGDTEIRQLNKTYRRSDKSTDVLSFPLQETLAPGFFKEKPTPFLPFPLGDVIISVDTAERQARSHKHSLGDEIDILLVHGILHLIGYDHEKKEDAKQMMIMEAQILRSRKGLIQKSLGKL